MTNERYNLIERTPKELQCAIAACPAIYEGLREMTPKELLCIVGSCPAIYEATIDGREVYLAVGKQINPFNAGIEKKVGEGEALIEVPRALVDGMKR